MWCHRQPDRANDPDENVESREEPALEAARRPDPDQVAHEEPEIEAAGMNQQALPDEAFDISVEIVLVEDGSLRRGVLRAAIVRSQFRRRYLTFIMAGRSECNVFERRQYSSP